MGRCDHHLVLVDDILVFSSCRTATLNPKMVGTATGIHTLLALQGELVSTARGLLGLAACAIRYTDANLFTNAAAEDKKKIKALGDAVGFSETRKRSPRSPMCTGMLSDNPSDAYLMLELETLTVPFAQKNSRSPSPRLQMENPHPA